MNILRGQRYETISLGVLSFSIFDLTMSIFGKLEIRDLTQVSRQKRVLGQNAPKLVFAVKLSLGVSSPLPTEWTVGDTEARSREIDDCDDMLEVVEVFDLPVLLTIEVKARIAHQLYESFILDDRRA